MAKTIKFNLICDNQPVRTIEDLQNNFSIEDVLNYYNSQLLHRWLRVRGYEKELEAVYSIKSKEPMEIIGELIRIFGVETDKKKVEEGIRILRYQDERKELYDIYDKEKYNTDHIIDDYEVGYRQLVDDILAHPNEAAVVKANISEIVSNYAIMLKYDHRRLFHTFRKKSYLAVMCLLMNEKSRDYYLPKKESISSDLGTVIGTVTDSTTQKSRTVYAAANAATNIALGLATDGDPDDNADKNAMYSLICQLIKDPSFENNLGENLMKFSGKTNNYWKDLEPKGKRFMIISMDEGDYVRPAGLSGGDLKSADVRNKFVIIDGIDYESNNDTHTLRYMEV